MFLDKDNNKDNKFFELVCKTKRLRSANVHEALGCIPHSEFFILVNVIEHKEKNEAVTVSQLCKKAKISQPAISRTLRTLESKGYINRVTDVKDRRNVYVEITKQGIGACEHTHKRMNEFFARVLSHISDDDLKAFMETSSKLIDAVEEEMKIDKARATYPRQREEK